MSIGTKISRKYIEHKAFNFPVATDEQRRFQPHFSPPSIHIGLHSSNQKRSRSDSSLLPRALNPLHQPSPSPSFRPGGSQAEEEISAAQRTSLEGPSLHPELGEGRPGVVERRVGHGGGGSTAAQWRVREASCKLVTGSLTPELQQAASERRRVENREGRGGTEEDQRAAGLVCVCLGESGGGITSFKAPGRRSRAAAATVTVSRRDKEACCNISSSCSALHLVLLYAVMDEGPAAVFHYGVCQKAAKHNKASKKQKQESL